MRIACPFCGERENGEFTYLGDAKPKRPFVAVIEDGKGAEGEQDAFYEYVYLRDNVAGEMSEYWYHGGGCRSWLVVKRNTLTHEILSVAAAPGTGAAVVDVAMAKAGTE
ncbi:sarcosine oxidase subunit delta [Pseudaminobacter soli (ex Li et al. 2025)]|uniref:Sarcosine oxidase subunit delta n=1 Tax=Pseudaminobacter soli (ex Li et al. 2025) TaxID=1295366 RepID=A0A2P7SDR9_9HYPH|nr:sarcosine oxidase subunit delta [Mesorhizobium soli]PSJ60659.1 sarcosine oxidase subunit delta [Mesorhizobium soli]